MAGKGSVNLWDVNVCLEEVVVVLRVGVTNVEPVINQFLLFLKSSVKQGLHDSHLFDPRSGELVIVLEPLLHHLVRWLIPHFKNGTQNIRVTILDLIWDRRQKVDVVVLKRDIL